MAVYCLAAGDQKGARLGMSAAGNAVGCEQEMATGRNWMTKEIIVKIRVCCLVAGMSMNTSTGTVSICGGDRVYMNNGKLCRRPTTETCPRVHVVAEEPDHAQRLYLPRLTYLALPLRSSHLVTAVRISRTLHRHAKLNAIHNITAPFPK